MQRLIGKGPNKRWIDDQTIVDAYNAGLYIRDIAPEIGCSEQLVYKVLNEYNIDYRGKRRAPPKTRDEVPRCRKCDIILSESVSEADAPVPIRYKRLPKGDLCVDCQVRLENAKGN